jgi:competence protein ComEC
VILFYVALAFLSGVIAGALGFVGAWPLVALGGAGTSIGWLLAGRRREALLAALLVLIALAGIERYDAARPSRDPGGVALLNDSDASVTLRGVIVSQPEERETSRRFTVAVDAYLDAAGVWQPAPGRVLVTSRLYPAYAYGDEIELTGRLETPPVLDGFDYREYLARQGVVSTVLYPDIDVIGRGGGSDLTRRLQDVRNSLSASLEQALPEPESALARGILLGERASIPGDLTEDFNRAGISHLIAISGQNVVLVAGFVVASLASLIGRRPATAIAMGFVLVYAVFVGASPSVLRAAVMATVMLGAVLAGRPASALPGVVLAAAVLVAAKPLLIDDVSFQLSFAATLGIVLASQRLRVLFLPRLALLPGWLATFLAENAAITTAASLAVLPVIAGTFGRISLVSLPANLLAAPVFVLALLGSAATALAGVLHPGLGRITGEVAYLPLNALVRIGRVAADVPGASLEVSGIGTIEIGAMCVAVAAMILLVHRLPAVVDTEPASRGRVKPALAAAALVLVAAVFVWWGDLRPDTDHLSLTVLDVGQGDALLIETPAGARILVDGGPSGARLVQALGRQLSPSERRIDLIVLTHAQDDHVTGFVELLQRYEVGGALAGPLDGQTAAYEAWREELAQLDVPLHVATAGRSIDLGDGVRIEILGPPPEALSDTQDDYNNNSVVLRLVYGSVSFLLTGDLAAEGEDALLASGADLHSNVLKVGHHGSDGSTTPAFLDAVGPELAVISAGADNNFGHPSPTTRLRLAGVPLLRTDLNGDVRFETDGSALWVAFERGDYARVELGAAR